jgi:hypothetical protein
MIRYCSQPGCTGLAAEGRFCQQHKTINYQAAKNKQRREPWYGRAAWSGPYGARGYKLRHFPMCEICGLVAATEVHHRDDTWRETRNWRMFIDQNNLISTCTPCHSRETMTRNKERGVIQ